MPLTGLGLTDAPPHPAEEHDLAAASGTSTVWDAAGRAVGQHATVLPGSLEERDVLARIDRARWEETAE